MTTSHDFAARAATHEKGPAPEGRSRSKIDMIHMPQTADTSNTTAHVPTSFSEHHRAAMWLEGEIAKARKGVTTQVVDIGPGLAGVLLERNSSNRKIRQALVDAYARDMEHGKWDFNGEPIIVARDGSLNDGQHRCTAIVESGATIPCIMVIGVDRETRKTVDQGAARTISDYLGMDGYTDTAVLGAAAKLCWCFENYGYTNVGSRQTPTKGELRQFITDNPFLAHSIAAINDKTARAFGGKSMLSFCHWAFWRASDVGAADLFINSLQDGANLLSRDPILYLRNRLATEGGRLRQPAKIELIFRTWNAWRRHETPKMLPVRGGTLPVLEA